MRFYLMVLACLIAFPLTSVARNRSTFNLNQSVFLRPDAKPRDQNPPVDVKAIPIPATIGKSDGDWYWLKKAWVHRKDLMSAREAVEFFTEQVAKKPNDASLRRNLGLAWKHAEVQLCHDFALKEFKEALRQDPADYVTYQARAEIWSRHGKYDDALNDLNEAIRIKSDDASLYSDRAAVWSWKRNRPSAIGDYDQAIKLDPSEPSYYQKRRIHLYDAGDLDGYLKDSLEIIRLCESGQIDLASHPYPMEYAQTYSDVARIKATFPEDKYRDGKRALELATKAYEISRMATKSRGFDDVDILQTLASVCAETDDFENAVKWAKQALKWSKKPPYTFDHDDIEQRAFETRVEQFKHHKPFRDPEPCHKIAWAKATSTTEQFRDGKRAIELATIACQLSDWKNSKYLATLAAAYAETGDFEKAIEWQQKAIEVAPEAEPNYVPRPAGAPPQPASNSAVDDLKKSLELFEDDKPIRE